MRMWHHRRQMTRGRFRSPEPEWDRLGEWLRPGDTALDVGANVGHYACRMSQLVGASGRVIAWGGTFAIAAFVIGLLVARPAGLRLMRLNAGQPSADPGANAERLRLQRIVNVVGVVNVVLLLVAAVAMAVARYV